MKKILLPIILGVSLFSFASANDGTGIYKNSNTFNHNKNSNYKGWETRTENREYDNSRYASTTGTSTVLSTTTVTCIQNAIEKRETALINAHDIFNIAIKNALILRKDSLKAVWSVNSTNKVRNDSKKLINKIFKDSVQKAHNDMRTARTNAWSTFDADMKICGVRDHGEKYNKIDNPSYSL
jgi:hypothetical protein